MALQDLKTQHVTWPVRNNARDLARVPSLPSSYMGRRVVTGTKDFGIIISTPLRKPLGLVVYADAAFINDLKTRHSIAGYVRDLKARARG